MSNPHERWVPKTVSYMARIPPEPGDGSRAYTQVYRPGPHTHDNGVTGAEREAVEALAKALGVQRDHWIPINVTWEEWQ